MAILTSPLAIIRNRLGDAISRPQTLRRFFALASWTLGSFALEKGATIVLVFMLARVLGAEDYGRLTLAQGLVNAAQVFVVLGAGTLLARYIPEMRRQDARRAVEIINLCALVVIGSALVVAITGLLNASLIATTVLELPVGSPLPGWMVAWVLFTAINSLLVTVMLSFEKGRVLVLVSLVCALLTIFAVPMLASRLDLEGAVAALVAVEVARMVLLMAFYDRLLRAEGVRMLTPVKRGDASLMLSFGAPVFLSSAIWMPTVWIGQFILKTLSSQGLTAVAVFGICNNLVGLVLVFSQVTNRAALPILSSLKADSGAHVRNFTYYTTAFQIALATLIAIPTIALSPYIMAQLGSGFSNHWPTLLVMMVAAIVLSGQQPIINVLLVADMPYINLLGMVIWSVVFLTSATWLISAMDMGAMSLAIALIAASLVRTAFNASFAMRTEFWSRNA